uniref:non-specific serine/threonine protein kinase n=1 Tax=Fundulus heteroclitus TaxID=8078 RepID=A0A3Q2PUD3_FUNHE
MTPHNPESAKDGRPKKRKRTDSREDETPRKRIRVSEEAGPSTRNQDRNGVGRKVKDEVGPSPLAKKRKRGPPEQESASSPVDIISTVSSSSNPVPDSTETRVLRKRNPKRKAEDPEEPQRRKKRKTKRKVEPVDSQLVEFQEKYVELHEIGKGGFGSVNAGYRWNDKLPSLLKQLVEAAIHLQNANILHRDIKIENILIEIGPEAPRIFLIDFGLSCFDDIKEHELFCGTLDHIPADWYTRCTYCAGPTTVWQLGVVLFEVLHGARFETTSFIAQEIEISEGLSTDCQDFLRKCLMVEPEDRSTLEELLCHPWFS